MMPEKYLSTFEQTLYAGQYNLLFGSGISLDSRNAAGVLLESSDKLRLRLCKKTGAPTSTSLSRVYGLLSRDQIVNQVATPYRGCTASSSLSPLPLYLWRRILTFNIDDVVENLYNSVEGAKQEIRSINYSDPFEPTPQPKQLQLVHLHGKADAPDSGFVFSPNDYVRVMAEINPWVHLLSQILATEPFIVSGTSLNEIDLEYYLSHRSNATPKRGRGPSLLITPNSDIVTASDCKRFDFISVKSTFGDFLEWLHERYPNPPTLADLVVPDSSTIFGPSVSNSDLLTFYSDFEQVVAADIPRGETPSPYLYGRKPDWADIDHHFDIERAVNSSLMNKIQTQLRSPLVNRLLLVLDEPGTGKSTAVMRVGHDLARLGKPVLRVRTLSRIDTIVAKKCLSASKVVILVLVDGLADHAEQIQVSAPMVNCRN